MLPTIGLMIGIIGLFIGMYIITRMLSYITSKDDRKESILVKIFSIITILSVIILSGINIILMIALLSSGS